MWKTEGLSQALDEHGFDAAFGGARRDEEKSRAKERMFCFRDRTIAGIRRASGPSSGRCTMSRKQGRSMRVFPLSNWTELDVWQYIQREKIQIVPLYFAAERPTVERDGLILMVDDERMPLPPASSRRCASVRFRTLGCYPLSGAVESEAATLEAIIAEMLLFHDLASARAARSTATPATHRWRRRSRRAISDGAPLDSDQA